MVLTIKHRFSYYKRFVVDIWGLSLSNMVIFNKISFFFFNIYLKRKQMRRAKRSRFIYRIDIINLFEKKKRMKFRFLSLRLVRLFFLTLKYRQFRRMAEIAASKDGLFQGNYCLLLEGRLVPFLYRTNFISNLFEIISFVKGGNMYVNNILVSYVNLQVKVGDIVTFPLRFHEQFRKNISYKLLIRSIVFNTPRYMFVSYKLFFAFMQRQPLERDLIYPIKMDIYRATAFY